MSEQTPARAVLRCDACGRPLFENDVVLRVERAIPEGSVSNCCSETCASAIQQKDIAMLKDALRRVESQTFLRAKACDVDGPIKPVYKVSIYAGGACLDNPGPGGWGTVLLFGDNSTEISGGNPDTTINRMELIAILEGLNRLKVSCEVDLYSESKYIVDAILNGWIFKWKNNGWMRTKKIAVKNADLWDRITTLCERHIVHPIYVKKQGGDKYSQRCKEIAAKELPQRRDG